MKTKLIIHPGLPKTGTSSIQAILHDNHVQLGKQGFLYPKAGQWDDHAHHDFALALQPTKGLFGSSSFEKITQEIMREATQAKAHTVIISSELSPVYHTFGNFRKFSSFFDEIEVIITLRRQCDLFESFYRQIIKDPQYSYLGSAKDLFNDIRPTLDYLDWADEWEKGVPRNKIKPIIYSSKVVSDFIVTAGVDVSSLDLQVSKPRNVSPGNATLTLLKMLNYLNMDLETRIRLYSDIEKLTLDPKSFSPPILSSLEKMLIDEAFQDSNSRFARRYYDRENLFEPTVYDEASFEESRAGSTSAAGVTAALRKIASKSGRPIL